MDAGSIIVKIKSDLTGFSEGMDKAHSKLKDVSSGFMKAGAALTAGVTLPITAMGVASVNAASDLAEAMNASSVVFGKASQKLTDYAKSTDNVVMSTRQVLQAATPLGAALQNAGLGAEEAADKSVMLINRAQDLASVFNTDVNSALQAIQAGLRGEIDPLEKFGVGLSDTALKTYAWTNGIAENGKELTQQQKVLARTGLIMEQTNKVQGDAKNTAGGFANQVRILQKNFEELSVKIGNILMPIAQQFLGWLGKAVEWFDKLSPAQQNLAVGIGVVAAAIGPLLVMLGMLGTALTALQTHPIILTITAIVAALVLLGVLINEVVNRFGGWQAVFDALKPTFEWFKQVWNEIVNIFNTYVIPAFQMLWSFIQEYLIPPLKELWERHGKEIIEVLKWLGIGLLLVAGIIVGSVIVSIMAFVAAITLIVNIIKWFGDAWNWSIQAVVNLVNWLAQSTYNAFNWIVQQIVNVINWFRNIPGMIGNALSGVWNAITSPFRQAFDWVRGQVDAVVRKLKDLNPFQRHSPSLYDLISKGNEAIVASYGDMFASINQMATQNPATAIAGGGNPVNNGSNVDTRIFGNITIGSEVDANNFLTRLTKNQELANKGLTTNG